MNYTKELVLKMLLNYMAVCLKLAAPNVDQLKRIMIAQFVNL